jgi:hypothetical protein
VKEEVLIPAQPIIAETKSETPAGKKFVAHETLHHKVAPTKTATLSDRLHSKPIKDLKTAIGINEKFLFITRLFHGDLQHYSQAVDRINSESSLSSAKDFINTELWGKFEWNENDEHVKHFIELVERRFTT